MSDLTQRHGPLFNEPETALVLNFGIDLYFVTRSVSEEMPQVFASLTLRVTSLGHS
jgi:hypothetical protein